MNATSQRAREACESCRKTHKKCEFDGNSKCRRCERIRAPCSLFTPVEATAIAHQGAFPPVAAGYTTGWGTPHPASQNFAFQENVGWDPALLCAFGLPFPAEPFANQEQSEQPAASQDGSFDQGNVLNDHDGA